MTIVYDRQYRPQTDSSSGANDPLSVAAVRELEWAINNAKAYAMAHKTRSCIFRPPLESADGGSTDERVVMVFAPVYVPRGYHRFRWYVCGNRVSGSGSVTWRLYCATQLYNGTDALQASKLGYGFQSDALVIDSDSSQHVTSVALEIARDASGLVWPVLTAQNSDGGTRAILRSLDIVPRIGSAS